MTTYIEPWSLPSKQSVQFEKDIIIYEAGCSIDYDDVDHDQQYEIARLIASAPDLSNALNLALRILSRFEPNDARAFSDEFVAIALAADLSSDDESRQIVRMALERED